MRGRGPVGPDPGPSPTGADPRAGSRALEEAALEAAHALGPGGSLPGELLELLKKPGLDGFTSLPWLSSQKNKKESGLPQPRWLVEYVACSVTGGKKQKQKTLCVEVNYTRPGYSEIKSLFLHLFLCFLPASESFLPREEGSLEKWLGAKVPG